MATRTQNRSSNRSSSNAAAKAAAPITAAHSRSKAPARSSPLASPAPRSASPPIRAQGADAGHGAAAGDWDEILAAEHDVALAIFDRMLATDQTPDVQAQDAPDRALHGLDKHAYQEEMVVYPALKGSERSG